MAPSRVPQSPDSIPDYTGQVIGDRYRIDALIDEGSMGRVYQAEHVHMRKRVAVKILRPELTRVPEVMARFEREAMAAAHIEHQHVAAATDFGKLANGSLYLVLEFVEGRTLRNELERGPFEWARALRVACQIGRALEAAHRLEIIHRDLKPENVMLLERGTESDFVKVLDFGVAKVPIELTESEQVSPGVAETSNSVITKAGMVFGTPDYMSPEQALGQEVDARADLYSLGVICYEMLTGVRPFKKDHELGILGQQLKTGVPPFSKRVPDVRVPPSVEQVVMSLLVNEASSRLATAEEAVAAFESALRGGSRPIEAEVARQSRPSMPDAATVMLPRGALAPQLDAPTIALPPGALAPKASVVGSGAPGPLPPVPSVPTTLRSSSSVAAVLRQVKQGSSRVMRALARVEQHLGATAKRFPQPWNQLPGWALLVTPLVFLATILVVVFSVTALRSSPSPEVTDSSNETSLPAPSGHASDAELTAAIASGEAALNALREKYPEDLEVRISRARLWIGQEDYERAIELAGEVLQSDPSVAESPRLAQVVWETAQKQKTQAATFALLKGPMKSKGADIIYDLAVTSAVRAATARKAARWLDSKDFERVSSPQASVAAALFRAQNCRVRRALVKRAENVGDQRSVPLLQQFAAGEGCTKKESAPCNACLKDSEDIAAAVAAIEKRATHSNE